MSQRIGTSGHIPLSRNYLHHPHSRLKLPNAFQARLPAPEKIQLKSAHDAAQRTRELLDSAGWCFWKCRNLNNEIIVITRDETIKSFPQGYPLYTEQEIAELGSGEIDEAGLRLIHQIKKQGAVITRCTP